MEKVRLAPLGLDGEFRYSIEKKAENPRILANARLYCDGWPSLMNAIDNYISNNHKKWNLKKNEKIGYLIKGKTGYSLEGKCRKQVDFYRIN